MAARNPGGKERAKRETIAHAWKFELCVALTTPQKYDWFLLGV